MTTDGDLRPTSRSRWVARVVILCLGAAALAATFRFDYTSPWFYLLSAGLGGCWVAGWLLERPWDAGAPTGIGRSPESAPRFGTLFQVAVGVGGGAVLAVACALGAILFVDVPVIGDSMAAVISPVQGTVTAAVLVTALAVGAAEELMFRGALFRWFGRHRVLVSTALYTVVTTASGSIALILVAVLLGLATGLLRWWSRALLPAILAHVTWSGLLLSVLPQIISPHA